jgi:UDP-2,4-diacetamido-2,4,6-trideoxy-beta-L-altropyranose hydrolase
MVSASSSRRIFFRADANAEIGLGHVTRCISLAQILSPTFACYFIIRQTTKKILDEVEKNCREVFLLDRANRIAEEITFFPKVGTGDIVVLDGYAFDTAYQQQLKSLGVTLVYIDDIHAFHLKADVVINPADAVDSSMYSAEPYTRFFLGVQYALLRKPFYNHTRSYEEPGRLLICFGGSDTCNNTVKVVHSVKDIPGIQQIFIVTGSEFAHFVSLRELIAGDPRFVLYQNISAQVMAETMASCQIAICPSSGISLESFAMNLFLLTGTTASNQNDIYTGLQKYPNVRGIGDFNAVSAEDIQAELIRFIELIRLKHDKLFHSVHFTSKNLLHIFESL